MIIKLIAGLGNMGMSYSNTRHNIGANYISLLADHYKVILSQNDKLHGYVGQLKLDSNVVCLLIPNLYMNNNGVSIAKCVDFYQLHPQEVLVAHDDLDLLPGIIRIKLGKKHYDSHRGLKNVTIRLNNKFNFYRLRIGIGHPGDKNKVVSFVLNKPSACEANRINNAINEAILCTKNIVTGNFIQVMNKLHAYNSDI